MGDNNYYIIDEIYSKDGSIKIVVNRICKTIILYFDSYIRDYFFNRYYYENHLSALGWIADHYNDAWINELTYSTYHFALNIISDYSISSYKLIEYYDDLEEIESHKSDDGAISAHLLPRDILGVRFENVLIAEDYLELLKNNHWRYDRNNECWCNRWTEDNVNFINDLIYEYELEFNEDYDLEDEEIDIGEEWYNEYNNQIENIPLIEISSDDGAVLLDNLYNEELKLYFEYNYLDSYYWNNLEKNNWEYDFRSLSWYKTYSMESYFFAIKLIVDYNHNPLIMY